MTLRGNRGLTQALEDFKQAKRVWARVYSTRAVYCSFACRAKSVDAVPFYPFIR